MTRLAVLIASFGYTGYFPIAPGTAGSAAALALFALVRWSASPLVEAVRGTAVNWLLRDAPVPVLLYEDVLQPYCPHPLALPLERATADLVEIARDAARLADRIHRLHGLE